MILSEMRVMGIVRDSYIPKGEMQGRMQAKLIDGSTTSMVEQFVNVNLTAEQVAKVIPKLKVGASIVSVRCLDKMREVYAGAPLKVAIVEFLEIDGKPA